MPEVRIKKLPEKIDQALRIYMARYNFKIKGDAIADILGRFFSKEDYDFFLQANEKMPPEYEDKLNKRTTNKRRR